MSGRILVVGGAGYIGSHMVRELLDAGYSPAVFDNLSTGHRDAVPAGAPFIQGDLAREQDILAALASFRAEAVLHFAASSLVGESIREPLKYYRNNVACCLNLLGAMEKSGVNRLVFSSTAAVYGEPARVPIREDDPTVPVNPYGESKLMIERILRDLSRSGRLAYVSLRYFNACGARPAAGVGERHEPETHLIPNVLRAASGRKEDLTVFGEDYPTPDGTCIRDYIHVQDLAEAHLLALEALRKGLPSDVFNLGNGGGYSVRQIIASAETVTGRKIRAVYGARRPGDPAVLVAGSEKARRVLGWRPRRGLEEILRSAWAWEQLVSEGKAGPVAVV